MPTEGWETIRDYVLGVLEDEVAARAQRVRNDVVEELSQAGQGRTYRTGFKSKKHRTHQASAPGDAPAVNTGRLRQSIVALQVKRGHWRVGTNLEYAIYLEFGTRRMAPRPFLRTAVERERERDSP